jgi:hypothetical protein
LENWLNGSTTRTHDIQRIQRNRKKLFSCQWISVGLYSGWPDEFV